MGSLVLKMSISLDGYVAPPDGSGAWKAAGRSDDSTSWVVETVSNAGAHLVGAATYAEWAAYWPGASGPFAEPMNEIRKVVFSNSLASADWPETAIAASAPEFGELLGERSALVVPGSSGGRTQRQIHRIGAEHVLGVAVRDDRLDAAAACAELVDLRRELHAPVRRLQCFAAEG